MAIPYVSIRLHRHATLFTLVCTSIRSVQHQGQMKVMVEMSLVPNVSIGTFLLKVDGLDLESLYKQYKWIVGGSNDVSGFRQLLNFYTVRYGEFDEPPEKDFLILELLDPETSKVTQTQVPWKAYVDPECKARSASQMVQPQSKTKSDGKQKWNANVTKREMMSHHLMKRQNVTKQGYINVPSSGNGKYEL